MIGKPLLRDGLTALKGFNGSLHRLRFCSLAFINGVFTVGSPSCPQLCPCLPPLSLSFTFFPAARGSDNEQTCRLTCARALTHRKKPKQTPKTNLFLWVSGDTLLPRLEQRAENMRS